MPAPTESRGAVKLACGPCAEGGVDLLAKDGLASGGTAHRGVTGAAGLRGAAEIAGADEGADEGGLPGERVAMNGLRWRGDW